MPIFRKRYLNNAMYAGVLSIILIASICLDRAIRERVFRQNNLDSPTNSTLIMGDSHAVYGVDEKQLADAVNVGGLSESFEYTYYKLKKLLWQREKIERVILTVSYHSFSKSYGNKAMLSRYGWILPTDFIVNKVKLGDVDLAIMRELITRTAIPIGLLDRMIEGNKLLDNSIEPAWRGSQEYPIGSSIGKREYLEAAINRHFYTDWGSLRDISKVRSHYFDSIVDLCVRNNVKLVLITTPVRPEYLEQVPDKFKKYMLDRIGKHSEFVYYYDLNNMIKEFKADDFLDYDHLNTKGAAKCTEMISLWIQSD